MDNSRIDPNVGWRSAIMYLSRDHEQLRSKVNSGIALVALVQLILAVFTLFGMWLLIKGYLG